MITHKTNEIKKMTLRDLKDYINFFPDFMPPIDVVIRNNKFNDERHLPNGICNNGVERLVYTKEGFADIKPMTAD